MSRILFVVLLLATCAAAQTSPTTTPDGATLFDFNGGVDDWKPLQLHDVKEPDPPVTIASKDSALHLTFNGGGWPCAATSAIPIAGNWSEFQTLRATLTVDRPTIALFRLYQTEQDEEGPSHWERTMVLKPGKNDVILSIRHGPGYAVVKPANGDVKQFAIGAYRPAAGQTLLIDNVRLAKADDDSQSLDQLFALSYDGYSAYVADELAHADGRAPFKVAGTDLEVKDIRELGKHFAGDWKKPPENSLEQVEQEIHAKFDELKATHPRAVLSILRDGEKRYDPADSEKVYAGWRDTHISCHGPDGPHDWRENNQGKRDRIEAFMRHRSALMRVDLSFIPKDARILDAKLVITRYLASDLKAPTKPNMWVVEPCAREWNEHEVSGYLVANDNPWKAVNGIYYGPDPDFHPVFLAHGPGNIVSAWDFTAAVRFWQTNANHGFLLHGDSNDYMHMATHEVKDITKRPAVYIVWEAPG